MLFPPAWVAWMMLGASTSYVIPIVLSGVVGAMVGRSRNNAISDDDIERIATKVISALHEHS
jgi:hypothetical protein